MARTKSKNKKKKIKIKTIRPKLKVTRSKQIWSESV